MKFQPIKRDDIKFRIQMRNTEAQEMMDEILKLNPPEDAVKFSQDKSDKTPLKALLNRYRGRLASWRASGHIPPETWISLDDKDNFVIYFKLLRKDKRKQKAEDK